MSGPPRWRDAAGGASPEIRGLLGAARRSGQLPGASRASSAARVAHLAATPAGLTTLASLKGLASAAGLGAAAAVVVLGAASLLETPATMAPPVTATAAPPVMATAAPRATATAAPPVPLPATSASAPRRAPSGSPPRRAPTDPPPAPSPREAVDTLVREAALLEQARSALAGDPVRAQAKLDEHAATFPTGKLGLEREMMAVEALRRLGRADEARTRAEALLSRAGGTPYEGRVRRLLEDLR